jgi:hypothetical protein
MYATSARSYEVPQLGVHISTKGGGDAMILTLAPSARTVALKYQGPEPAGRKPIRHAGIEADVPNYWEVVDMTGKGVCPNPSLNATVLVGDGLPAGCPPREPSYSQPVDGSLAISDAGPQARAGTPTQLSIDNGETNVAVESANSESSWDAKHLQLSVRVDGGNTVSVTLGLGRDGRVAAAILRSLRLSG